MVENKDNIVKLNTITQEEKPNHIKINEHLCKVVDLANAKCLLAMIINQDDEVELVTKSVFEPLEVGYGLHLSLHDLEAMSLGLANLVAVLKVNKLIK